MIEAWGRGIERILEACREAGTPEPELRHEQSGLWVEFRYLAEHIAPAAPGTGEVTGRTPVETPVKTPDRIVELLRANPYMTLTEVAWEIGRSLRAVERAAAKLASEGRLRYVGPRKGGHWETLE